MSSGSAPANVRGPIVTPDQEGFDLARQAFNLAVDQQPAAVAMPVDAEDVAATVRYARGQGLRIAPQTTGHNPRPLGDLSNFLLLKTSALKDVEIDAGSRTARVGSGVQWKDIVPQASDMGLAALHGSSPGVGVTGYTLGGGIGWYGRKLGLASSRVTAVELVTADGEHLRADHQNEPDLFWALRGGGGDFGVVTALEFELFELEQVYAGALFFPWERTAEVLHAWHEWTATAPEEATSLGHIVQFPPFPEIPEPMRGNSFVIVETVFLGDETAGEDLMRPLRELGPAMETLASVPPAGISGLHMDPPDPVPGVSGHQLLGDLPPEAIDAFVEQAGPDSGSPLMSVELRHTGGALGRTGEGDGALSAVPGSFLLYGVGLGLPPEAGEASSAACERLTAAMSPYQTGALLNFVEQAARIDQFFDPEIMSRLREAKERYDPDHVVRANHSVV